MTRLWLNGLFPSVSVTAESNVGFHGGEISVAAETAPPLESVT
jgi:hypothetical protein